MRPDGGLSPQLFNAGEILSTTTTNDVVDQVNSTAFQRFRV